MERKKTTKPANTSSLGDALRNPLVVFGLALLAGDGPLVIAYSLTLDPMRAWMLLAAIVLFTFGMMGFFCYLVAHKPRHLYAPTEIPKEAFGKSIYSDYELVATFGFAETGDRPDKELKSLSSDVLEAVIDSLSPGFCRYLSNVANRAMTIDKHLTTLLEEASLSVVRDYGLNGDAVARGYLLSIFNFKGVLFEAHQRRDGLTFRVSPEILGLITKRLN